jgi:UDP-3-O-[3-hydroxymyristoyl] glucosamine N-acyltransferase
LTLESAAAVTGSELSGDGKKTFSGVASAAVAGPDDIAFLEGGEKEVAGLSHEAGAVIVSEKIRSAIPGHIPVLVAKHPRHAHAQLARALFSVREIGAGAPAISPKAVLAEDCSVAPGVVIGDGVVVGSGTRIGANTVIGPGVQIGRDCRIGTNVYVGFALVGDHVTLLSGARIGEAGFGVVAGPEGLSDAPHLGRVIMQDHVSVGANSCIDRGVFEDTIIGERTKIDNLCQIAHNVVLGRSVVIAAFGGISGSVTVGDGSLLGGRVGVADHVHIADGVSVAAGAGVMRDVGRGETWGGLPAKPIRQWMREIAWLQRQTQAK